MEEEKGLEGVIAGSFLTFFLGFFWERQGINTKQNKRKGVFT